MTQARQEAILSLRSARGHVRFGLWSTLIALAIMSIFAVMGSQLYVELAVMALFVVGFALCEKNFERRPAAAASWARRGLIAAFLGLIVWCLVEGKFIFAGLFALNLSYLRAGPEEATPEWTVGKYQRLGGQLEDLFPAERSKSRRLVTPSSALTVGIGLMVAFAIVIALHGVVTSSQPRGSSVIGIGGD